MKILLFVLFALVLALPIKAQENQSETLPETPPQPTRITNSYVGVGLSLIAIDHGEPHYLKSSNGSSVLIDNNDYHITSANMIDIVYGSNFSENKAFELSYSSFDGSRETESEDLVWLSNGNPVTLETAFDYTAYGVALVFYKSLSNTNSRLYGRVGLASVTVDTETTYSGSGSIPITHRDSNDDIVFPLQLGVEIAMAENLALHIGYHTQTLDISDEADPDDKAGERVSVSGIMLSINNRF